MHYYLEGTHVEPKDLKNHIGKKIEYLRECDIDKSGRGYFFPRTGTIEKVINRNIYLENGDVLWRSDLREVVLLDLTGSELQVNLTQKV